MPENKSRFQEKVRAKIICILNGKMKDQEKKKSGYKTSEKLDNRLKLSAYISQCSANEKQKNQGFYYIFISVIEDIIASLLM